MHKPRRTLTVIGLVAVALVGAGCGSDDGASSSDTSTATGGAEPVIDPGDGGDYRPAVTADDFVTEIDNPYLPFRPGMRWVYEGVEDGEVERIEVVVTNERRRVYGVDAVVVRDTVTLDGELVEDTYDWFAQDRDGNVWYLGEESTEYEDGEAVSTEGSWEAGVDGALPGIVMPADPQVGAAYRQEFYEGEAEDLAEIVRRGERVSVPAGDFDDVLVTREWNPFEPDVVEEKFYASGVGLVMERKVQGGDGVVELLEYSTGA